MIFGPEVTLSELAGKYWPVFPAAFIVSLLATPLCRWLALRLGIVDRPNDTVKTHKKPTAYMGGVGILAGVAAGLLVGYYLVRHSPLLAVNWLHYSEMAGGHGSWVILAGIGVGAVIACAVGLLDDILDIRPWQKLLGQMLAAAVVVAVGIVPNFTDTLEIVGINLPSYWNMILGAPVVLFFILGATNSLNLLDGLDALCAGVTSIITVAYLFLAVALATWGYSTVGDPVRLVVCLALVGGTLGFLPLNRHPASIFMGDAGSMLLGFIAGTVMLLFTETIGRWSIAAIVIFGLPILDTSVAIVRRVLRKQPLFVSDRGHIYDQMMDRGRGLKKTVKRCYFIAFLYALVGIAVSYLRFRYAVIAFVLVMAVSAWLVVRWGFVTRWTPKSTVGHS